MDEGLSIAADISCIRSFRTVPDLLLSTLLPLLLAPCVGSFLAVLADRLPRGEDVVTRPSACRACGARLGPADLVPVLSFCLRRGHCGTCAAPIPSWLLYVEIAATGLAALAVAAGGGAVQVWVSLLWLWLLLALGVADARAFRLPDVLVLALCAVAAAGMALVGAPIWPPPGQALAGALLGSGAFLTLRLGYRALRGREGLGLGDVKLMAGLGAFAGPFDLPLVVLMAALGGLAGAVSWRRARLRRHLKLPFGSALCAAAGLLWLLRAAHLVPT
ncbi:prepilin peptidase [Salipiger aestuarii]|uniref:prepilin peptidase n=1 Tax=Salipiger aestuarii TaxID=568098 RepID=UPI001239BBAB|nr:A24 family peptidase [Salipiger aestuarii]